MRFAYGVVTLCDSSFQDDSATQQICNSVTGLVPHPSDPTTPNWQRHQAFHQLGLGYFPVSLATTQGVAVAFLSSGY